MKEIKINTDFIKLDALLKWSGIVGMGSEAKMIVQGGAVRLNGNVETQRGKKIVKGDIIEFEGESYKIV